MENKHPMVRTLMIMLGIAVLISLLIFVLQVPPISIRRLLIGERVLGSGQFWLLEFLSGVIISTIITFVAVPLYRRRMLWIAAMSAMIQLIWLGVSVTYVEAMGSIGTFLFRSAEPAGIVLGAAIAVLIVRGVFPSREVQQ